MLQYVVIAALSLLTAAEPQSADDRVVGMAVDWDNFVVLPESMIEFPPPSHGPIRTAGDFIFAHEVSRLVRVGVVTAAFASEAACLHTVTAPVVFATKPA